MSIPTSDVAICRLALDLVKEKGASVSDIDSPTTVVESVCSRWFDVTRRAALQKHDLNFASKSEAIPRGGTPSVSIYPDYYTLPNDYLKLRSIVNPDIPLSRRKYEIQSGKLLYDGGGAATLDVWFVYDHTTVSTFPAVFVMYLVGELALRIAYKITAKAPVVKLVNEFRREALRDLLAFNGQERPPRRYENSRLVDAGLYPASKQEVAGSYEFDFDPN